MTWEELRSEVKKQFKSSSPYRMGLAAGKLGIDIAHPYKPGSLGDKNFKDGVLVGRRIAKEEKLS